MLFKHLLTNTILFLTSVAAIPNPNTEKNGVEARDGDGFATDHLVVRGRCGNDAYMKHGNCFCRHSDKKWDGKRCICSHGRDWDWREKRCKCSHDRDWDWREKRCKCSHGRDWDWREKKCKCSNGRHWDWREKKCKCPH
ncbi:hypothetical protein EDB81DRAFT_591001, partial [Dactylonectria macrodidyma]